VLWKIFEKGRIYIPKDEMKRFNLKVEDIQKRNFTSQWVKYKKYWVERNYEILKKGLGLGKK
jgi:phytoene/squalene synthetase